MPAYGQPPLDGNASRAGQFIATIVVTISIATLLICLRIYVRARIVRALALDDLFIVLALIFAHISLGLAMTATHYGLGQHLYYLPLKQFIEAVKYTYLGQTPLFLSASCSRISICLFLLRLFVTNRRWRIALWTFIALIAASGFLTPITLFAQCRPVAKLWNPFLDGSCWSPRTQLDIEYFMGAAMTLWDFVLAGLPIVFLWDIRITPKVKAGICGLMGLGVVTGICAVMRTILIDVQASADPSWDIVPLGIWFILEVNIAMIAASIPAIQPLFRSTGRPKRGAYIPQADSNQRNPVMRPRDPYALSGAPDSTIEGRSGGVGDEGSYDLESYGSPQRGKTDVRKTIEITIASDARDGVL